MVTTVRETERKYEGPALDIRTLREVRGVAGVGKPARVRLDAVYFDTADLRLARAGITLRRRKGGSDEGWHAKLPAGVDSRDELRTPLGRSTSDKVPAELAELVLGYTGGAELAPCARVRTARTSWTLLAEDSGVLAEVVADKVTGQSLGDSVTVADWTELEVELVDGEPRLLERIETRLAKAGIHRSASSSKLRRALGSRLPDDGAARHSPVSRLSDAGTVVTGYLRSTLAEWRAADVAVRRDETEGVHDLRVTVRRMRSTLRTFRKTLRADAVTELHGELKWISDILGEARDVEVLADRLDQAVGTLPVELVLGPVPAELTRYFAPRRASTREAVLTALRDRRYLDLLTALDELAAAPPLAGRAAAPATKVLAQQVRQAYRRTAKAVQALETTPAGAERDEALHTARKAAKRARYAVEAARPVFGRDAKRLGRRLKDVQSALGEQHDTVAVRETLRELAVAAHGSGGNGFTFGLLHGRAHAEGGRHELDFAAAWAKAAEPRATRWLSGH
jgi:CHAD domain-containing protein